MFKFLPPGKLFMLFCHMIFFKIHFLEKFFQEYYQIVQQFGPNFLQRLSADDTRRQRVNIF